MFLNRIILLSLIIAITSCNQSDSSKPENSDNQSDSSAINIAEDTAKIVWSDMDTSVAPQDNFFLFCNGNWISETEIPESEKRWSNFNILRENNEKKLRALVDKMKQLDNDERYKDLVGKYYLSFMDSTKRNELGLKPIKFLLDRIQSGAVNAELLSMLKKNSVSVPFGFYIGQDMKKNDQYSAQIAQGGLGLPNKKYYTDEKKKDIRTAYKKYISDMFVHLGESEEKAKQKAKAVFALEKKMAKASMSPEKLRDPKIQYNPTAFKTFTKDNDQLNWRSYFQGIGSQSFDTIVVAQPEFFKQLNILMAEQSKSDWKAYYTFRTVNSLAGHLDDSTAMIKFDFYSTTMNGIKKRKPSWKRGLSEISATSLNEALGHAFVDRFSGKEAKEKVSDLVDNLELAFKGRLDQLEWMSDSTKKKALEKLHAFGRKLAYPDVWEDYSKLEIEKNKYLNNYIACHQFSLQDNLEKLGQPIDTNEWLMPPHKVNAYFHPLKNEIVFPAGIMQPPFFDANATDAVNYGRIGMVIGHEFTHGFDDKGSLYNGEGKLKNWWTEKDRKKFKARASNLGATFAKFCPFEGVCVRSELTMGENIADLGGLTLAYHAYQKTDEYKAGKKMNGYTPSQQYFIAFGQLWKNKIRDEALKKQIASNPHSPGKYRVNGPLMNMPEFFEAFNVQPEDPMRNKDEEVARIW